MRACPLFPRPSVFSTILQGSSIQLTWMNFVRVPTPLSSLFLCSLDFVFILLHGVICQEFFFPAALFLL